MNTKFGECKCCQTITSLTERVWGEGDDAHEEWVCKYCAERLLGPDRITSRETMNLARMLWVLDEWIGRKIDREIYGTYGLRHEIRRLIKPLQKEMTRQARFRDQYTDPVLAMLIADDPELPRRVKKSLASRDILTFGDLTRTEANIIKHIRGMGKKSYNAVCDRMAALNIMFEGEQR